MNGTVSWFDARRGVGAIAPDDGAADIAVSCLHIDGGGHQSLRPNDRVSFTVVDEPHGRVATQVYLP